MMAVNDLDDLIQQLEASTIEHGSAAPFFASNPYSKIKTGLLKSIGTSWEHELENALVSWFRDHPSAWPSTPSASEFANLAALAPSLGLAYPVTGGIFQNFTSHNSFTYLQNKKNFLHLTSLSSDGKLFRHISPSLLMALALSASVHEPRHEDRNLSRLLETISGTDSSSAVIRQAISTRLSNRKELSKATYSHHGHRVALLITGQMRSPDTALPQLAANFKMLNPDVYVSTWQKPGLTKVEPTRYKRIFSEDLWPVAEQLQDNEWAGLSESLGKAESADSTRLRTRIEKALEPLNIAGINIDDECHPMFAGMSNHAKMYWHNYFWPTKLGKGFLSHNYDFVIKVRPDISLKSERPFSLSDLSKIGSDVATEFRGWKFNVWGLGSGDQVIYGRSDIMEQVLSTWWDGRRLVPKIVLTALGKPDIFLGHQNTGLEIWLSGSTPVKMSFGHGGFHSARISSMEELRSHIPTFTLD